MKLKFEDGTTREVEALDINVWNGARYGDAEEDMGVLITAYPMERVDGLWVTHTDLIVFSASTDLDGEDWDDDWFGMTEDTAPGEIPAEVARVVNNVLKEITVTD